MLHERFLTRLVCAFLAGSALHATLRSRRLVVRRTDCPFRHIRDGNGHPLLATYDENAETMATFLARNFPTPTG